MKAFLTTMILLVALGTVYSQPLPDLIAEYKRHCNETVLDTVEQTGYVYTNEDLRLDTVWLYTECPTYKFRDLGIFTLVDDALISGSTWYVDTMQGPSLSIYRGRSFSEDLETVTRPMICEVKRRELRPWSAHFWQWVEAYNGN